MSLKRPLTTLNHRQNLFLNQAPHVPLSTSSSRLTRSSRTPPLIPLPCPDSPPSFLHHRPSASMPPLPLPQTLEIPRWKLHQFTVEGRGVLLRQRLATDKKGDESNPGREGATCARDQAMSVGIAHVTAACTVEKEHQGMLSLAALSATGKPNRAGISSLVRG